MAELGVIPSPDGPYVELGESAQGALVRKQILHLNKQFIHPKTGKPITLGEDAWQQMKANFDGRRVTDYVTFPLANEKNQHDESPEKNAGQCVGLERDGDKVFAVIDVRDPAVAEKIANKTLLGASAFLHLDARDAQTGERRGVALLHVAGTNRPALVDLAPYENVAQLCDPAWTELPDGSVCPPTLLMLCQSDVDPAPVLLADDEPDQPDYQPEPDYRDYGGGMDEDFLKGEVGRLGLLAYQESRPGRGTRPEYAGVITDRDRQAALSAEREISDQDILEATAELAGAHQVSTDSVHAMAHDAHQRSGLGRSLAERARVLGEVRVALSRGQLEVDDDQCLALTQLYGGEEEVLRLTAEPDLGDMFVGLAEHPVGKMITSRTRAHASEFQEDPVDHDQPGKGGDVHKKVRALIERNPDLLSDGTGHEGGSGNRSIAPKSPAQRQREELRARAGGRPQSPITR